MNPAPKITTAFDLDLGCYAIFCDSPVFPGRVEPAGARLFRAPPHPEISFQHGDEAACEKDAEKLRAYLSNLKQKEPSKKQVRAEGA